MSAVLLVTCAIIFIAENQPIGTAVGTFSTTDPDAANTFTYTLVSGTGSTDNASFAIVGGKVSGMTVTAAALLITVFPGIEMTAR